MSRRKTSLSATIAGRRMRARREELGWSQDRVGVAIGIDESSSRVRISRYELGVHEPPLPTAKLIAEALVVPLVYLYCEEDFIATLLLALHRLDSPKRESVIQQCLANADSSD